VTLQNSTPAALAEESAGLRVPSLSVSHSVLSADALARELDQTYGIEATSCSLLRAGTNDTYVLRAQGATFLARVYGSQWRRLHEIEYELALLLHLAGRGVDVCLPVSRRDGQLVHSLQLPEGDRHIVVFTHVESTPMSWDSPESARLVGRAAAQVHAASAGFATSHARFCLDADYLIDASLSAIRPFLAHRVADWAGLVRFAEQVHERIAAGADAGLDWGVCHGDVSVRTIATRTNGRTFAFDFDLCAAGWRAFDLAAVRRAAAARPSRAMWEEFVDGYTGVRPLSPVDLGVVPLFEAVRELWRLGMYARNVPQWGLAALSDAYLDRKLVYFRRWETEATS
jgi:Ser/Thr protein kinase RdoA (MazF antagonist)